MTKHIRISDWLKDILDEFKRVENHSSFDKVLRSLIIRALFEKKPTVAPIKNVKKLPEYSYEKILKQGIRDKGKGDI